MKLGFFFSEREKEKRGKGEKEKEEGVVFIDMVR